MDPDAIRHQFAVAGRHQAEDRIFRRAWPRLRIACTCCEDPRSFDVFVGFARSRRKRQRAVGVAVCWPICPAPCIRKAHHGSRIEGSPPSPLGISPPDSSIRPRGKRTSRRSVASPSNRNSNRTPCSGPQQGSCGRVHGVELARAEGSATNNLRWQSLLAEPRQAVGRLVSSRSRQDKVRTRRYLNRMHADLLGL
jgi:hypothetical protein